ncbi:MAG: TetR/AcrR family transcriptional regulator [Pararhodobacter sp.]|nr:TetR/AcrR family transcriptional regulator [Pararhodobacter sp.]
MNPDEAPRNAAEASAPRYHHGDLRTALLQAAEAELAERGIGGLTLRGCARRAGVSHAAPKHHFPTLAHLLTALAGQGFERLAASIRRACAEQAPGSLEHLVAACAGYVAFARANPALFRLMFRQDLFVDGDSQAEEAAAAAFALPVDAVAARTGATDPLGNEAGRRQVAAVWALAHGVADLAINGQFCPLEGDAPEDWQHQQLRFMLCALFPER